MPKSSVVSSGGDVLIDGLELVVRTIVEAIYYIGQYLWALIFSPAGWMLLGFILISTFTLTLPELVPRVLNSLLTWWYGHATERNQWADIIDLFMDPLPLLICWWNFWWHLLTNVFLAFIDIAFNCVDLQFVKDFLFLIGTLLLTSGSALVQVLENPLNGTVPVYNNTVWTNQTIWTIWQDLTDKLEVITDCECHELQPVTSFVLDRLSSDNLGQAIDLALNAALAAPQALIPIFTDGDRPDFDKVFNRACSSIISLGAWADEWIEQILVELFAFEADIGLGCMVSRIICIAIEVVKIVFNFTVDIVAGDNVFDTFRDIEFEPVVGRIDQLAGCLQEVTAQIDPCLGEALGAIVRFVGDVLEFATKIIQDLEFDWAILFDGFFEIIGNQQYDILGGDSHIIPCDEPPCDHLDPAMDQTGLTCLVSKILGDGECARAFSDLVSAVLQVLTLPIFIAEEFLTTDYTSFSFASSNPLSDDYRDDFNDLILDIVDVFTDRFLLLADYLSHLISCIPGLEELGLAFVSLTAVLDNIVDDVKTLALLLVEVLIQAILWILALFGVSPFEDSDAGDELVTFFSIFLDALIQLFDLIVEMLTGFLDYFIFSWFPSLFGQGTMLSDNPGTARFTECFTEMTDCICGITKNIANDICLPAGGGCLGNLWPDCGDFEPGTSRRRSTNPADWYTTNEDGSVTPNMNVYEYWATEFNGTFCGEVFQRWADSPPQKGQSVGELDGNELIKCVNMVSASLQMTSYYGNQSSDALVHPEKLRDLGHLSAEGYAVLGSVALSNTILMFSDPDEVSGLPESSVVYFDISAALDEQNIVDPMVKNSIVYTYNAMVNVTRFVKTQRNNAFKMSRASPNRLSPGYESIKLVDAMWRAGSQGIATVAAFGSQISQRGIVSKLRSGAWSAGAAFFNGPVPEDKLASQLLRKRGTPLAPLSDDPQIYAEYLLSQGRWPKDITNWDMFTFKIRKIMEVLGEVRNHLIPGKPTVHPRANEQGLIPENHIPESCTTVLTGCPVNYLACNITPGSAYLCPPVTCTGDTFYVPPFRFCNDFFGSALVAGFCNESGQVIDFYATVDQCEAGLFRTAKLGAPSPAFTCYDTLNPSLQSICIDSDGCTSCPVEHILPNFDCDLLDEVVHRIEYEFGLCFNKLGIGPPLPMLPFNITTWFSFSPVDNTTGPAFRGVCGNGVIERNYTFSYRNPLSGRLYNFVGEDCEPPGSMVALNLTGNLTNYTCGVFCQPEICGNGIIDPGEQCDDHNRQNGDWCNEICQLERCGNGIIDFSEDCDDGNVNNLDGCSATCKFEKCGQAHVTPAGTTAQILYGQACQAPNTVADTQDQCFNEGSFSYEFNCHAGTPLIWTYLGTGCFSRQTTNSITSNCTTLTDSGNTFCLDPAQNFGFLCTGATIQASADTVCQRNCPVCGDGIVEALGAEDCDDGTIFATGNATEDLCIACRVSCACDPNPLAPCQGFCANEFSFGMPCDPRKPGNTTCGVDGICFAHACCGDGLREDEFESCDEGPDALTNSTCYLCRNAECVCQPGKPCLGTCYDGIVQLMDFANDFIYCDVSLNPFACPGTGQVCVPWSCCGDNITQEWETVINGGCEPKDDPSCSTQNCSYYDNNGDLKAPSPITTAFDFCVPQPGFHAIGHCWTIADGELTIICDRNDPSSCVTNGAPVGAVCRADSCCHDSVINGEEIGFASANHSFHLCEVLVSSGCPDDTCNYGNYYLPFDECVCQPNFPCVGLCFLPDEASNTDLTPFSAPCDPLNSTRSPWCDTSQPGVQCIPIACCQDGIVQDIHYSTNLAHDIPISLELCDNGTCPGTACDVQTRLSAQSRVYSRCDCLFNYSCAGLCTNLTSGKHSGPCDAHSPSCGAGLTCWPQQCCGDGILQDGESSEGVDNECGLLFPPLKRKRYIEIPIELPQAEEGIRPQEQQYTTQTVYNGRKNQKRAVTLYEVTTPLKPQFHEDINISSWIDTTFEAISTFVFTEIFGASLNETLEPIIERATSTEVDQYADEEDRGVLYYVVGFFQCPVPLRTDGSQGVGFWEALSRLVKVYFFIALFVLVMFYPCAGAVNPVLFHFAILVSPTIFLMVAYGYMFPRCLPMIPETVPDDVKAVATFLRQDCPFTLKLSNGTEVCMATVPDCQAAGFNDGFDSLFFLFETRWPEVTDFLRNSFFLQPILSLLGLQDALIEFNFNSTSGPTDIQTWCFNTFDWALIFQVLAIGTIVIAVLLILLILGISLLFRLLRFLKTLITFTVDVAESSDDRRAEEVAYY